MLATIGIMSSNSLPLISQTLLTSGSDVDGTNTSTTASFTTAAGKLTLLTVHGHPTGGNAIPTITDANRTWVQVRHNSYDGAGSGNGVTVFRCMIAATGTCTVDFGVGQTQSAVAWIVSEFANVLTTGTNGQNGVLQSVGGTGTSTSPLATLAAFGNAKNATFGAFGISTDTTVTPGTGFEEIAQVNDISTLAALQTEFKNTNDTTVDCTSGTSVPWGAIAVEVVAA